MKILINTSDDVIQMVMNALREEMDRHKHIAATLESMLRYMADERFKAQEEERLHRGAGDET